jgi:hypothetical protein
MNSSYQAVLESSERSEPVVRARTPHSQRRLALHCAGLMHALARLVTLIDHGWSIGA